MGKFCSFTAATQGYECWQNIPILSSTDIVHWVLKMLFSQGKFTSA